MADEAVVVDAEVVPDEDWTEEPAGTPAPSMAVARRERRSEVIRPLDVHQLAESFQEYQALLPKLLVESDYQAVRDKRFVKKSGWRKIATAFDLDVIIVSEEVERNANGVILRSKVIARAIAPSGRAMDGDGYCDVGEDRFTSNPKARLKLENDVRATATTRAKNRAIADLVGMGDVSAEEVGHEFEQQAQWHPLAAAADKNTIARAKRALGKLCGNDGPRALAEWSWLVGEFGGIMPAAAATTLERLAKTVVVGGIEPMFIDPTGDIPTEAQVKADYETLRGHALGLWTKLEGPDKALKRVQEAGDNLTVLRALVRAGQEAEAVAS